MWDCCCCCCCCAQDVESDALRRELFRDHMDALKRRRCDIQRHLCLYLAFLIPTFPCCLSPCLPPPLKKSFFLAPFPSPHIPQAMQHLCECVHGPQGMICLDS